jgi:integrase
MKQYVTEGIGGGALNKDFETRNLRLAIEEMEAGTIALADLSRADVLRLVDRHRAKPAVAYARFGALSRCMDWHAERDERLVNPCRLIGRKFRPKRPAPRQRVYTATEIKALWDAGDAMNDAYADFLRLMILAPLRRMECSELKPANLDKGRRALLLPQGTTKNGDAFVLPLPATAWEIVQRRARSLKPPERLFPLNGTGGAMNAWPYFSRLVQKASGVGKFMFHDLRRTFMTELAEAGAASLDTLDGCLNHRQSATRSGVRMAYLHATLLSAKTVAMTRWGEIVAHVVEHGRWPREDAAVAGENVLPLRPVAA